MKVFVRVSLVSTALCSVVIGCGCGGNKGNNQQTIAPAPVATVASVSFTEVAQEAGISFKHTNGAFGKKWLPETMGSGFAWIDYDGDGYPDLFIVNSREWTAAEKANAAVLSPKGDNPDVTCKLFHNEGNGKFTDVTVKAHLNISLYGMGVSVGDYDNDGHPDLYVTALGKNHLFHNNGNGTFTDMAAKAGLADGGWSTSSAWVDYDKDGKLDLVVCHYVKWTPATDIPCPRNNHNTYCTPQQYQGEPISLYHNNGNGTFTNVSAQAGMLQKPDKTKLQGKSLGITICDYDGDGYPDIAVANDTEPNYLFHNEKNGTFKEQGVEMGMAYGDSGAARGAMGIDAGDYDQKGRDSLVIGNFSSQGLALYHNEGGIFRDVASQAKVMQPSLLSLTFGCIFMDADNDGWLDIFIANGHVDDDIQEVQKQVEYAQQPHLFHNQGNGNFEDISNTSGPAITAKYVARGAAYADYDLRGVLNIGILTNNGPFHLLRNNGGSKNHSLRLELEGTKSNRSAIGAVVWVKMGSAKQMYVVRSGSSYCSQSELPITVGLGQANQADSITITWPSGEITNLPATAAGQSYQVVEGKGIANQRPFGQPRPKGVTRL